MNTASMEVKHHELWTSPLDRSAQLPTSANFTNRKRAQGTHWMGGRVGQRAILYVVNRKSHHHYQNQTLAIHRIHHFT